MAYRLLISKEAREQLRALPAEVRKNIGYRLDVLQKDFLGDIKKLEASRDRYRLRVGGYRVLFRLNVDVIEVYAVKQRKIAYE